MDGEGFVKKGLTPVTVCCEKSLRIQGQLNKFYNRFSDVLAQMLNFILTAHLAFLM